MTRQLFSVFALFSTIVAIGQNGYIDSTFGNNGYACFNSPNMSYLFGDLLADGNAIYALTIFSPMETGEQIVKYDSSGQLITAFGNQGALQLNMVDSDGALYDFQNGFIRKTPDNKFLAVGATIYYNAFDFNFIAKFDQDGNVDTSFGNEGYVGNSMFTESVNIQSVDIINDEIIVTGYNIDSIETPTNYLIVLKFDLNGNPIESYGNNGIAKFTMEMGYIPMVSSYDAAANAVYSLVETSYTTGYITKLDLGTNTVDTSFGTNGQMDFDYSLGARPTTFYVDTDENMYVAGTFVNFNATLEQQIFVRKYTSSQELDTAFGVNGTYTKQIEPLESTASVAHIMLNPDNINLVGYTYQWSSFSFDKIFINRIHLDGTNDTAFGQDGSIINYLFSQVNLPLGVIENNGKFTFATASTECSTYSSPTLLQIDSNASLGTANPTAQTASVYPNPVKDILYVNSLQDVKKVQLYDYSARLLPVTFNGKELDVSNLEPGIYLFKIFTDSQVFCTKIVKE
jgi:uncharacterized delta-60 repeat protein